MRRFRYVVCDVFTDRALAGNQLAVFTDARDLTSDEMQALARETNLSETVFCLPPEAADADVRIRIFTPARELPFAGHPLVGTAWLLGQSPEPPALLRPPVGDVHYTFEDSLTWVQARAQYSPNWELVQLPEPAAVTNLSGPPDGLGHVQAWAWQDQDEGVVRARVFASDYGVPEDPATGSAAIVLCAALGRGLRIIQGQTDTESEIRVQPLADGCYALGGRVVVDRPPECLQLPVRAG